jgi:quinol monooxygenase YgiN
MATVLIRHTVEDFDEWKPGFDAHADTRTEYGSEGYRLFTVDGDRNEVVALFEWDSTANAKRFFEESDVKERMDELGVVGEPEVLFLDEIEASMPEQPAP